MWLHMQNSCTSITRQTRDTCLPRSTSATTILDEGWQQTMLAHESVRMLVWERWEGVEMRDT